MKNKFVIIDAMSLAYKAYYAFINRPLKTVKGEPTSAVYGFVSQLLRILETNKPDYIAVAFDSKEKTFRHERYENYKSSRAAMPEDMIPQISRIKEIIEAFNIPVYILPGYEADDIIGTAVKKAEAEGLEAFAITPDKDFNQLVSDNIKIVKPGKTTDEIIITDVAKIKEDFGFEPIQMIDYLALVGDTSDDIPGVAGIGPKGATPLIQQYGSVEKIYENIDKIEKASIKQKLIDGKENAFLSKELATIYTEVPLEFDFSKTVFCKPDFQKLFKLLHELEFRNLDLRLKKIFTEVTNNQNDDKTEVEESISLETFNTENVKYHLITKLNDAKELANKLKNSSLFVFDTETDSLDTFDLNLAGVSFCINSGEAYFIALDPYKEKRDLFSNNLDNRLNINDFIAIYGNIFADKNIKKVCQNGKFDIAVLKKYGIEVANFFFDTMIASYVLDPDQKHGMDDLSMKYLNYKPIPISELIGNKKDASKIFDVDIKKLSDYSSEDADITFRLYKHLSQEIEKNKLHKLCYDIEFPLVIVLEDMEREGVKVDEQFLKSLSNDLQLLLDNYSREIWRLADEQFNINSPVQLQRILYDKLKLSTGKKTKTGFSTDAKSLDALQGEHEIIDILQNYRQVQKLKSTYSDALPQLIHPKTGRIHTSFNQSVVSTGRLSSNNPNLQNIPIRTELGKEIRKAFIPRDKNHLILSADYSQIELRIMASICNDEGLCEAFRKGEDIHRRTAALVFQVNPENVTSDMRRKAKEVNFGILYGIGVFGLKTRLGISQEHAKEIIDTYFRSFKNVKEYMDLSVENAKAKGYAETLTGRRRYMKNINSSNRNIRSFEERAAINMPIQGTAADMIKIAMINIHKELEKRRLKTKMVLQVHDELVFDAHKDEIEEVKPLIKNIMESAFPLNVPLLVEMGIGDNWLDAH